MNALRIRGRDIRVGDVLVFQGRARLLTRIEPYEPPAAMAPFDVDRWRVAYAPGDEGEWCITLPPDHEFDVVPGVA